MADDVGERPHDHLVIVGAPPEDVASRRRQPKGQGDVVPESDEAIARRLFAVGFFGLPIFWVVAASKYLSNPWGKGSFGAFLRVMLLARQSDHS